VTCHKQENTIYTSPQARDDDYIQISFALCGMLNQILEAGHHCMFK